ncbi:LysR family transcriptional regulator [Amylibacter ulvae]|uniref:LysR family transcriptional regulator n=2 Tax=Paramylibacter ulvae TaxID=1651968 RepID=A0ABQ3CYC0_9RHOB|nr:LysR family transcriptional regulator [Amylibacter ulvae]
MHMCMEWRNITFDWNRARAFLVTAEEGSYSAAARALNMAQPTLGRQVDALERDLGVVLFQRVGRGLALTDAGLDLLAHARKMGDGANELALAAAGQSQTIAGTVRISASDVYAAHLLPAIIAKLRKSHPAINVEIIASHTTSDLRRREADIALRNFRPAEPDLIAKKIRDVPARLYATSEYLERIGTPKTPADLSRAEFISIDNSGMFMRVLNEQGLNLTSDNFPLFTENYLVMWEMVKQGLGIGVLDGYIGDAEPRVGRALPDFPPLMFPIWLVAHRELASSKRIRVVFDLLASQLAL